MNKRVQITFYLNHDEEKLIKQFMDDHIPSIKMSISARVKKYVLDGAFLSSQQNSNMQN